MTNKEIFDAAVKAQMRLEEKGELSFYNAFKAGYDFAISMAREWLYDYNSQQAKKHGSKATLGITDFTINVADFSKALMESSPN